MVQATIKEFISVFNKNNTLLVLFKVSHLKDKKSYITVLLGARTRLNISSINKN